MLTDFDKRTNAADKAGTAAPVPYKATYAFINGDFGVHAMKNATVSPVVNVGYTVVIRVVNAGMISHPLHFQRLSRRSHPHQQRHPKSRR